MFSLFNRARPKRVPPPPAVNTSQALGTSPACVRPAVVSYSLPPVVPAATTGGISYDPNLVAKLKGDHAEMITIYSRLLGAAQTGAVATIREDLILFRRVFQGHILMESVRFYVYLDRLLANHDTVRDEARAVRKDMNGIAKAVADFIHNWLTIPITAQTLPTFIEQLQGVGAALVGRVELEERTLYTLYTETL